MTPVLVTDSVTTDLQRAVRYALLWGLEGVVLRTVGGAGDRVPFINENAVRQRLAEEEMGVVAIDPGIFEGSASRKAGWLNDVDTFEEIAPFCKRMRCDTVRIGALAASDGCSDPGSRVSALTQLGERAAKSALRLAVRNECGTQVDTGVGLAELVRQVGLPNVGADWHPEEALRAGEEPEVGLRALLDGTSAVMSVGIAHIGSRQRASDGECRAAADETGVDWLKQFELLTEARFSGPLALEVRERPSGPAGLAASTALLALIRQARRAG